jgi:hypothetical protein
MKITYEIEIIDKLEFDLTLFYPTADIIDIIKHHVFVLGYFPTYCWISLENEMKNSFKWSKFKYLKNIKALKIKFESKYDDGLYNNTIICPNTLYHLTPQSNKNSIILKGIYPKSKNRISNHPERIYLFDNINDFSALLKTLKFNDILDKNEKEYILISINCEEYKLILHTDPNYRIGWYTYDNINPYNISIMKENL